MNLLSYASAIAAQRLIKGTRRSGDPQGDHALPPGVLDGTPKLRSRLIDAVHGPINFYFLFHAGSAFEHANRHFL